MLMKLFNIYHLFTTMLTVLGVEGFPLYFETEI
jgi:hypothetical protein